MRSSAIVIFFYRHWIIPKSTRPSLDLRSPSSDMYSSTLDVLLNLYEYVVPGGIVLIDDYDLQACRSAVREFRKKYNVQEELIEVIGGGVYWIRK